MKINQHPLFLLSRITLKTLNTNKPRSFCIVDKFKFQYLLSDFEVYEVTYLDGIPTIQLCLSIIFARSFIFNRTMSRTARVRTVLIAATFNGETSLKKYYNQNNKTRQTPLHSLTHSFEVNSVKDKDVVFFCLKLLGCQDLAIFTL